MEHEVNVRAAVRRGFLLMATVVSLALLLIICVGFLSFTRGEVVSVASLRNRNDCSDIAQSAIDWTVANLKNDLFSGNDFNSGAFVSGAPGAHWWYRPYEPGFIGAFADWEGWGRAAPAHVVPEHESAWVYLPEGFFPEGGVRARISVQVLDPNGVPNINDWLEDCNPTQCQMAHMIMCGYGEQELEKLREWRDGGNFNRSPGYAPLRYHEAWRIASRTIRYMYWPVGFVSGTRYRNMLSPNWVTTNTAYMSMYGPEMNALKPLIVSDGMPLPGSPAGTPLIGLPVAGKPPNYYPPTRLEGYPSSPPTVSYDSTYNYADPLVLPAGYHTGGKPFVGNLPIHMPFYVRAYVDPDTGRSPVNVNTCLNSGERLPTNLMGGTPVYAMEAVFNVESLRRIVKVGTFYMTGIDPGPNNYFGGGDDLPGPGPDGVMGTGDDADPVKIRAEEVYNAPDLTYGDSADYDHDRFIQVPFAGDATKTMYIRRSEAILKIEKLRTQMAFQYQETLCRYFTGTYKHNSNRQFPPLDPSPGTPVAGTRFPMGVTAFRTAVASALTGMATGSDEVDFDASGTPSTPAGKLDRRVAEAVYDNIVPGSVSLGLTNVNGKTVLQDLYDQQLGRDELRPIRSAVDYLPVPASPTPPLTHPPTALVWPPLSSARKPEYTDPSKLHWHANVHGFWEDDTRLFDSGFRDRGVPIAPGTDGPPVVARSPAVAANHLHLRQKGLDVAKAGTTTYPHGPYDNTLTTVPWRQLCFGPDWFSTELTTSTTTFILIINAQVVEAKSIGEPGGPRVISRDQWGVCLELAPDVNDEDSDDWEWYKQGKPAEYKTALATDLDPEKKRKSVDYRSVIRYGHSTVPDYLKTAVKEFPADLRGVKASDWNSFYGSSRQTRQRVLIRAVWSTNQSLSR